MNTTISYRDLERELEEAFDDLGVEDAYNEYCENLEEGRDCDGIETWMAAQERSDYNDWLDAKSTLESMPRHVSIIVADEFKNYIQEMCEECDNIPEHLIMYIDWDRVAADAECDYCDAEFLGTDYKWRA